MAFLPEYEKLIRFYGHTLERTIKRILVDYNIESLRLRAEKRRVWSASLAAINIHLDAQVAVLKLQLFTKLGLTQEAALFPPETIQALKIRQA